LGGDTSGLKEIEHIRGGRKREQKEWSCNLLTIPEKLIRFFFSNFAL